VDGESGPPTGTIAMLFTDVEGSTRLARELGSGWGAVLGTHHALIAGAISAEGGWVDGTEGDAFFATFADPAAAARAAIAAQRALAAHRWPRAVGGRLRVRMGLHVGFVEHVGTGYVGLEVHRAARIAGAAHGGQLLLSEAATALVRGVVACEPLGAYRLKDFPQPEALFCAVIDGRGAKTFPPPRTESSRATNLPAAPPTLVGRDTELARVCAVLGEERERLVTLTGRGGAGKTSLALAAATALLDDFSGGVWLARLANVDSTADLGEAIASAVDATLDVEASARTAVMARLRNRGPTLLVLDNLEHLLDGAGEIDALLAVLPDLQVLATSQAPLRLGEELAIGLDGLADEAALALIERVARRRNPALTIGGGDRQTLVELVHLLDGLPLALEVAAARLALLTPGALLARLRDSPDLLRDDRIDRPERQRSLRATVEFSLALLGPAARALFGRLGVFAGPVELEEVEAICGGDGLDVADDLARLLDVALIRRVEDGDGRICFGLPEGLRRLAEEELDRAQDGERWRRAHAERQRAIVRHGRDWATISERVYDAIMALVPERRVALRWAWINDRELAQELAAGHGISAYALGDMRELVETIDPLVADPPETIDPLIVAVAISCWAMAVGRPEECLPFLDRAVDTAEDPATAAAALCERADWLVDLGRIADSLHDANEAIRRAQAAGDASLGFTLLLSASVHQRAGELDIAARQLRTAVGLLERCDVAITWIQFMIQADLAVAEGRIADGLSLHERTLQEAERRDHEPTRLAAIFILSGALALAGEDAGALEVEAMAQTIAIELGASGAIVTQLVDRSAAALAAAHKRAPVDVVGAATSRGRAIAPERRVARACELARAGAAASAPVAHAAR